MPKRNAQPGVALISLLLAAAAASTASACTATTEDDAAARIVFTIALCTLAGCCLLVRYRDRQADQKRGDSSPGDPPDGG
ncbi:hypothetical protein OEB94_02735 [Streptomyces sp. ICN988]|uniref:hypothetical protein n=1 Tax=Streptomyces sp. ICN988 TaxID=2983765 RepID=UPI0021E50D80|nr:hypothetical protein [Streptomyces sp. ICN988]MCV2458203.1 hypothetical protein [Streptomyces sp. ICN988]